MVFPLDFYCNNCLLMVAMLEVRHSNYSYLKTSMNTDNPLWKFFSSVKLALFTLGCLAVTSIIGTLIPQKEAAEYYVSRYGPKTAQFFEILDIPRMYTSWWFLSLLVLLSINLIVCSLDRFPGLWRQIKADNLQLPLERIAKNRLSAHHTSSLDVKQTSIKLHELLSARGWKVQSREKEGALLLFAQKSPWSRTGVYIVHLSILIIFSGAIYGELTGFKAGILLPEMQSSNTVYPYEGGEPIDLGFTVRCNRFDIDFYANGMPKEYISSLTIFENDKAVAHKNIEVNHPLKYKGITFYQSSYQGYSDFIFTLAEENARPQIFTGEYQKELAWEEKNVRFGIINLETIRDRVVRMKIWFNDDRGTPSQFWLENGEEAKVHRPDGTYIFSAKQRYATGLQVAKDPGVWVVYVGFALMLIGLYVAFFLSHRRIWLILRPQDTGTLIAMKGSANKNRAAFEKRFHELADDICSDI